MTDDTLKPCPFCGMGAVDADEAIPNLVDGMSPDGTIIFVRCLHCGGEGPPVNYVIKDNVVTSWPEAVTAWNQRTDPLNEPVWETSLTEERLVRVLRGIIAEERGSIGENNLLRRIAETLEREGE